MVKIASDLWETTVPWIDRADADIASYVKSVPPEADFDLYEKLARWQSDGVVIFENCVDKSLIESLLEDIEYLKLHSQEHDLLMEIRGKQKEIKEITQEELNSPGLKFNSIHTISKAAAKLSVTSVISRFLCHVFKDNPVLLQSLTFFKGSEQPVHIDYPYVRTQKEIAKLAASWIPLEDIHPDSGPLAYYIGSHKIDVSGFFDWGNGSIVMEPDSSRNASEFAEYLEAKLRLHGVEQRTFCPKAGDALIWHGNLIHGGTPIKNRELTRKSYVSHYTSLSAYPEDYKTKDAFEQQRFVENGGGYVFEFPWVVRNAKLPSFYT